ncbi:MAG TPA: PQQ-binding-like beta-propeller repeat protein, partial [Tepidisphaeraceae bacterium]|nr:PQQ-binding-like beta-propeller repeat protein [Tepidisphaeraceae bacterium]
DWAQWRGPHFDGSSDAINLPDNIDKDKAAWKTQLPGVGSGTPVVFGDRIFLSTVDPQSSKLMGNCISRTDGKILWSKEIGTGFTRSDRNNAASPSAVTDGKLVYFYFSTGDLSAFDIEGKKVWERNIQKDHGTFNILWVYSSSPLLYKDKLYVQVIHRNVPSRGTDGGTGGVDSYLLAMNPQTGKDIWKVSRPSDAVGESRESYATPVPFEHDGRSEILLVGGDCVTAHEADTGKEIWRCGGWNPNHIRDWRLVPSVGIDPIDGLVFACAPKKGPVLAISDGGTGDVTTTHIAWKSDPRASGITSDVCVPLFYKGNLYLLDGDRKQLFRLDPKSGEKKQAVDLGGRSVFRASPTGADGKIYCMNEHGDVLVVDADSLKILSQTSLDGRDSRATIAVVDGMAVVRAGDKLYGFTK